MSLRRPIALLTLVAFLPLAAGCSANRSHSLHTDADRARPLAELRDGGTVQVVGFTTRQGYARQWKGEVSAAGADSLLFVASEEQQERTPEADVRFTRGLDEIESLETQEIGARKAAGITVATLVLGAGVVLLLGYAAVESLSGD